jgi:sortase A
VRLATSRALVKRVLWWTQRTLFAAGLSAIAYCSYVLADTWIFQQRANSELEKQWSPNARRAPTVIGPDGLVGRMQIPRLHLSAIIMDGTDHATLRHAVGHIRGTGLPGEPGNVGLAGHRDTFFRSLKHIRLGDLITLSTSGAEYRFLVASTRIVDPSEISVLDPTSDEVLTLVTCYPFYFAGPAPDRFIVRALRDHSAEDAPDSSP